MAKIPNEKMTESLFISRVSQALPEATFYAPSTFEEADLGYDAAFRSPGCRELVLQFKRPALTGTGVHLRTREQQHKVLRGYGRSHAYYVVCLLANLEVLMAQERLTKSIPKKAADPLALLDYYAAVDVADLTDQTASILFGPGPTPLGKATVKERGGEPVNLVKTWRASELIRAFQAQSVGAFIGPTSVTDLAAPGRFTSENWQDITRRASSVFQGKVEGWSALHLRIEASERSE